MTGREWEFRYLKHGTPLPEGWRLADNFEGCRHGLYAVLIMRDIVEPERCPFCGAQNYREIQEHGHYRTECCKQVTVGCCNGEQG